jgi:glycosyltransferase involved in cell wall biosynthesis
LKVLVWQWSRLGGPPLFATLLAEALDNLPGVSVVLSLSRRAEILRGPTAPRCELPVETYGGAVSFVLRAMTAPIAVWRLVRKLRALAPDLAVCAQPGPLDLLMAAALRRLGVRFVVIVHDADPHPGDGYPLLMWLQRRLCRVADAVAALSTHVGTQLDQQGLTGTTGRPLIRLTHPPIGFHVPPWQPHAGPLRLLFFGRLLPYKGIDLLCDALGVLGPRADLTIRVVGSGPDSAALQALSRHPGVVVENRWVPDSEIGALLGWADALVLPYREASQSGVAAAALAAGRSVVATNVGGLLEQLAGAPRALLCEPTVGALVAALEQLLATPPSQDTGEAEDPAVGWHDMAASLVRQCVPLLRVDDHLAARTTPVSAAEASSPAPGKTSGHSVR